MAIRRKKKNTPEVLSLFLLQGGAHTVCASVCKRNKLKTLYAYFSSSRTAHFGQIQAPGSEGRPFAAPRAFRVPSTPTRRAFRSTSVMVMEPSISNE